MQRLGLIEKFLLFSFLLACNGYVWPPYAALASMDAPHNVGDCVFIFSKWLQHFFGLPFEVVDLFPTSSIFAVTYFFSSQPHFNSLFHSTSLLLFASTFSCDELLIHFIAYMNSNLLLFYLVLFRRNSISFRNPGFL